MTGYEAYLKWLETSRRACQQSPFSAAMALRQQETRQIDFLKHLAVAPMVAYSLLLILHRQIDRFEEKRHNVVSTLAEEAALALRLQGVKMRLNVLLMKAARGVAHHVNVGLLPLIRSNFALK